MKIYTSLILLLLIALSACEKIVDADKLLDTEERVFIRGYISPQDTLLRVHVSKAFPAIGTTFSYDDFEANREKFIIDDAVVSLSNLNGTNTVLEYNSDEDVYMADATTLPILSEQQYFLEVAIDNRTYRSNCRIPEEIPENNIEYENIPIQYEFGIDLASGILSFQDFIEEGNLYAVGGSVQLTFTFDGEQQTSTNDLSIENFEPFVKDNLNNGGVLNARLFGNRFFGDEIEVNALEVTVKIAHIEEVIYQNIRASANNEDAEFDLFLEYSVSPNTILDDGAVGVFAGYNLTEKVVDIIVE